MYRVKEEGSQENHAPPLYQVTVGGGGGGF